MATHVFHKLAFSSRLFMKKAPWGFCVLVFDSSGEPPAHPVISDSCAPGGSGTEFEVGRTTSYEEVAHATTNAHMDHESSTGYFYFCIRRDLSRFHLCFFSGPGEVPVASFVQGYRITCRSMPLARVASAPIDFSSRDRSRTLWKQVFDDGVCQLK